MTTPPSGEQLRRWWVAGLLALLVAGVVQAVVGQARPAPLSKQQLEELVSIGTPDAVIASEVRQRGLGFGVDAGLIERFRRRGAGTATLRALSAQLPRTNLEIRTGVPYAVVTVGTRNLGTTDEQGIVRARLEAGTFEVTVVADRRPPAQATVRLNGQREEVLTIRLESPAPLPTGTLFVTGNVPGAVVHGAGDAPVPLGAETGLPVGAYQVQVTHACCDPFSAQVTIEAGTRTEIAAVLRPRPNYVETLLFQARSAIEAGAFDDALGAAAEAAALDLENRTPYALLGASVLSTLPPERTVPLATTALARWPDDSAAHRSLGQALAALGDWARAMEPLRRAVAAGETIQLPVLHHRGALIGAGIACPSVLDVSRRQIVFKGCSDSDGFSVEPAAIAAVEKSNRGAVLLRVVLGRGRPRGFTILPSSAAEAKGGLVNPRHRACDDACLATADHLIALVSAARGR